MSRYVDAENLKEFWWNLDSGTEETINDLISKYNLIDCEDDVMRFARELFEKVNNVIDTEPTADVKEVVRSKWIQINNSQEHHCENCGASFDLYAYCTDGCNFCPYCGADMREEL